MPESRRNGWQRLAQIATFQFSREPVNGRRGCQFDRGVSLRHLRNMDRRGFEACVAHWLRAHGMRVRRCKADQFDAGFLLAGPPQGGVILVQCKSWSTATVSARQIREHLVLANHLQVEYGLVVSSGEVSEEAKELAITAGIATLDGKRFVAVLRDHGLTGRLLS